MPSSPALQCTIEWYYSTDTQIVYYTPPSALASTYLTDPGGVDVEPLVVSVGSLDSTTNGLADVVHISVRG